jgi:hypothetical protein
MNWEFLEEIAFTVALFDGQQGFFQFFLPWPGLMFKPHRITQSALHVKLNVELSRKTSMSRQRIPDGSNAAVNSNEISDVNFELRITLIRVRKRKVGRTFSIHEDLSAVRPVGNPRRIQIF